MGKRCKEGARVCGAEINSKGKKKSRDKCQHQCQYHGPDVTGALKKKGREQLCCAREKELGHWEITEGAIFA